MINFTNTIHINRPSKAVYTYLANLENTPEWNWAITETRKTTPGPTGVGTQYTQTRSVPQPSTEVLEIAGLDPDRRIEVRGTLAQFTAHLSYDLSPTVDGTKLINTVNLEPQGSLRLISPILGGRIKRAVADNLNVLKAQLEVG